MFRPPLLRFLISFIFALTSPTASTAAPINNPAEKLEYAGMTEEFPPFNFAEKDKVVGYSTDVMQLIFKKAKLKTSFTLWPWLRAYNAAKDQPGHYVFSTSRSEEREKLFKWVGPIAKDSVYLMVLKDSPIKETTDFKTLKKYSLSGQAGDQPVVFLQGHGFDVLITAEENVRMKMLKEKKMEMDIMTTGSQEIYEKTWAIKYRRVAFLYDTEYWAAFNRNTPDEVIQKLNKAVSELKGDGTLEKIADKYRAK